jgi:hypothetical protein
MILAAGLSPIPLYMLAVMFTPLERTWAKDIAVAVIWCAVGVPLVTLALVRWWEPLWLLPQFR